MSHRRYNPLNDSWVLVSPHRAKRPWSGQQETLTESNNAYEPDCYLCPGNLRTSGQRNPDYPSVYVFDNDFPALLDDQNTDSKQETDDGAIIDHSHSLLQQQKVQGCNRVICYSPEHHLSMAKLSLSAIEDIIKVWSAQHSELSARFDWVQIFENRGEAMGCSNPHPHGQIWATDQLPVEAEKELSQQRAYYQSYNKTMLADYAEHEIAVAERVLLKNDHWLVVVPWWAVWPYETLVIALDPVQRIDQLTAASCQSLAEILQTLYGGYDNLFDTAFPYSMGWHSAPGRRAEPGWRLHAHCYPPLLRSATIKKFMVGYELLSEPQRDITAEMACANLRQAFGKSN